MTVITKEISLHTKGNAHTLDITNYVADAVQDSTIQDGIANVFAPGSTAGITTIEFESGVVYDLQQAIERIAPENITYRHDQRWHDGNGHSHVRAALVGPGLNVPFNKKKLLMGTWQQIVLIDFDNHPRNRRVIIQIIGD